MTRTAYDGAKVAHGGGRDPAVRERPPVTLTCGHPAKGTPPVGNPDRWWCPACRVWQERKRP